MHCGYRVKGRGSRSEVRFGQLPGQWRRRGLGSLAQRGAEQGRGGGKLTVDGSAAGPRHVDTDEGSFLESQRTRDSRWTKEQKYKAQGLLL